MAESDNTGAKAPKRRKASSQATTQPSRPNAQAKRSASQKPRSAASKRSASRIATEGTPQDAAQQKKRRPAHAATAKKPQKPEGSAGKRPARHARPAEQVKVTKSDSQAAKDRDEAKTRARTSDASQRAAAPDEGIIGKILPVFAVVLALVGATLLYRYVFPPVAPAEEVAGGELENTTTAEDANAASNVYNGVESPYTYSGYFSTGNDELDLQIKTFCDAIADPTLEARDNAKKVFEKIAQNSTYVMRSMSDLPGGPEWYLVCAEQYFASATPDQGLPGSGDYYDYAAAISYCLKYFGFSDALAIPLTDTTGTSYGQAAVIVTDVSGTPCICDPSKPYAGWMLDSYTQNLTVQNIGQDIAQEEAMGLTVQEVETDVTGQNQTQG